MSRVVLSVLAAGAFLISVLPVQAQYIGTLRWQLRPYCNVVTLTVTQVGGTYRLEGNDDQCGAASGPASVIGTAFLKADGNVGMGLNIVPSPGSMASPITTVVSLASLAGTWRDQTGASGDFAPAPGAGNGGSPRPMPSSSTIPSAFGLYTDGQFVARGTLGTGNIPASGAGVRMMWHPAKAAFRVGEVGDVVWNDNNIGINSIAFGFNTLGAGAYSTAFGAGTSAVGPVSTAMGQETQALGAYSTSMGAGTIASGNASTAVGSGTRAQGPRSLATGQSTTASGVNSLTSGENTTASGNNSTALGNTTVANNLGTVAMGYGTVASGAYALAAGINAIAAGQGSVAIGNAQTLAAAPGSFAFGDFSSGARIVADIAGQFKVRAAGGVRFATNGTETTGVQMTAGSSQWLMLSDVNSKHLFRELPGETVLARLAAMPIMEWSYKAQDSAIRHVGPTAQDFHAAFGLGEDARYIGSLDADGVALAAVRALEARTRDLLDVNRMLSDDNRDLREANDALRARLDRLEQRLGKP